MTYVPSIPVALCDAAAQCDPRRGFTFINEDREVFYSYHDLADVVAKYAAAMLRHGLRRGDRVVLALPDNVEFVFSFLGAMHAGLVPVPIYPPQGLGKLSFYLSHSQHILRTSRASMLITSPQIKTILGSLIGEIYVRSARSRRSALTTPKHHRRTCDLTILHSCNSLQEALPSRKPWC